ncbi:unnamed protein product, partial [Didymodactylos carnosus]
QQAASGCQRGAHGLPDELKDVDLTNKDSIAIVQEHFMKNQVASKKLNNFLQNQKQQPIIKLPIGAAVGNKFSSSSNLTNLKH